MPETTTNLLQDAWRRAGVFLDGLDERPVMPGESELKALSRLQRPLQALGRPAADVLAELDEIGSPAAVATAGGRFFGFVVGGALPVSVAANWLATAWDQNAGTWILAPGAAEFERAAAEWLLDLLDLPRSAVVGFVTGSTMGTFSAIAAARSALLRRAGWDVKKRGLNGAPVLRVVTSAELHPTNFAALGYAGIGLDQVEQVACDDQGRLLVDELPALDDRTILILQAGNINSGASDHFKPAIAKARAGGAWVHVDGAFGLWARASRTLRHQVEGIEDADSWSVDGHKWLNIPQDAAIFACRDANAVNDVFGVEATYLVRDATPRRQPNTFTPELSRRARGVEFWAALAHLGSDGVEALVDRCCADARHFARILKKAGYRVLNDVVLNQVVFACDTEERTRAALARIQASGVTWLGPTTWRGTFAMRISVSSWATTAADVKLASRAIASAYGREF